MNERQELLEIIKNNALFHGDFVLASGKKSNFYLDGRLVTLDPKGAQLIGKVMHKRLIELGIEAAGGLTMGADPIAAAVAVVSEYEGKPIKAFIVRKEAKDHGKQKQVEGPITGNETVAILEDTVTTGESSLKAIEALEKLGCKVVIVMPIIDRLDGAEELVTSRGYMFEPLFTIRDLGIE